MKIIISHAYSRENMGDAALVSALIAEVRREFDPSEMVVLTMDRVETGELFDGVSIESNFMYLALFRFKGRFVKLIYGCFMIVVTVLWSYAFRRFKIKLWLPKDLCQQIYQYVEADLIIPVGGGYLRGNRHLTSIYNSILLLHPMVIAAILGKPTVLFSQSVGPFYHSSEVKLLKYVLNRCATLNLIREDVSLRFLDEIGVGNSVRAVDAGFLLEGEKVDLRRGLGIPPERLLIGITARHWLQGAAQEAYQDAFSEFIDFAIERHGAFILFIPQVTAAFLEDDDRIVSRAILSKVHHRHSVCLLDGDYDHYGIKAIYDNLDIMVGTRFHSVIFALTSYVPSLAIEYEHKTTGIMSDLGLERWVLKIEEVTGPLLFARLSRLLEESAEYERHLRVVVPDYVNEARQAIKLTRDAYEAAIAR